MHDIINLLTADDAYPPLLDSMLETFVSKMRSRVETLLWSCNKLEGGARTLGLTLAYERLSEAGRLRLLLSPALFEVIGDFDFSRTEKALAVFSKFVECEHVLEFGVDAAGAAPSTTVWSALGDVSVRGTGGGLELESCEKLDDLIAIDFDSVHARMIRPSSPLMFREPEEWSPGERACVDAKLRAALDYVDTVAPVFGRLVRNYTRAIRLRKSDRAPGYAAEHVTDTIGELRMLNAHRPELSVARTAESLVHESVHNFLSTYEYLEGPFVLIADERQFRPVSPWSGNPIPVPSFCHAIFVWYSLFHLALRELERPGLGDVERSEILARRNRYANGFLAHPLADSLRGLQLYSGTLLAAVEFAQNIVRDRCDPGRTCALDTEVAA